MSSTFTNSIPRAENPFRTRHNLADKLVFMYSGNHSPSNPLTTILDAVVRLKTESDIRFLFVGGGSGKPQVEEYIRNHELTNAISLPYQPIDELKNSLTAADVHIVSLGRSDGRHHPSVQDLRRDGRRPDRFFSSARVPRTSAICWKNTTSVCTSATAT